MATGGSARTRGAALLVGGMALLLVAGCGGGSSPAAPTQLASVAVPATASPAAIEPTASPSSPPVATQVGAVCVAAPSGIVAWWRAEDDAKDAIGGHDGALQGGAAFTAGMVGRAFSFDGATQYVSVPTSAALQPTTSITLEGWVYASGAFSGYAGIAGTWDDNTGANRTYLFWVLGQAMEFLVSPDHNGFVRATDASGPFPTDQWVHVAATYDGTTIALYRDGVEVAKASTTGPIAVNDKAFLIGRTEGGSVGPNFWKGSIDELTLYNRALTADEVAGIHAAGSAGKCSP